MKRNIKQMYMQYIRFIWRNRKIIARCRIDSKENTFFWITPWLDTPSPFYMIVLALTYRLCNHSPITLVVNDMWRNSTVFSYYNDVTYYIKKATQLLKIFPGITVLKLSDVKRKRLDNHDTELLQKASYLNAIKLLHSSQHSTKIDKMSKKLFQEMYPMTERMCGLLSQRKIPYMVIPGGIFQEAGFLLETCKKRKIDSFTLDGALGFMMVGVNSVAAKTLNTGQVYEKVIKTKYKQQFSDFAYKVMDNRRKQKKADPFFGDAAVQICKESGKLKDAFDITIFVNIEDDSAALGTHIFYENDTEWLVNTVDFILNHTDYTIAIRQHPMARYEGSKKAYLNLKKKYKQNPRFKLYSCTDEVNSYELIENSKVVVVNTSSIGLESAMLGKHVITESESYYADAGFVIKCRTEKEYFDSIVQHIEEMSEVPQEHRVAASIYYGLVHVCSSIKTRFTADPQDYEEWIMKDLLTNLREKETKLYIQAMIKKQPVAEIKFKEIWRKTYELF